MYVCACENKNRVVVVDIVTWHEFDLSNEKKKIK